MSKNDRHSKNSTVNAECVITVKTPHSGYSISVRQISEGACYAYVYIKPYDDDVTEIQKYGKSPFGEIFASDTRSFSYVTVSVRSVMIS